MVRNYMLGQRQPMTDLMAWNADATRLPYRMHSEYLRKLFLGNDLFEGRYLVNGRPIALSDIRAPIFAVATETDHVAPWRSVHKIHLAVETSVTFVLTTGGHNAGIVSEPGHLGRSFHLHLHRERDPYIDPETWLTTSGKHEGSWWPIWLEWLEHQSGEPVALPPMSAQDKGYPVLGEAPGRYVLES
jgi:polyhydroxyalkanoate synthase